MAKYDSYNAYLRSAALNALPGPKRLFNKQSQEFQVKPSISYFTNTPYQLSSSFVRNIQYSPSMKTAFVRLGNKQYWYPMTQRRLSTWLNSRSLGQHYNKYVKL